MRTRRQLFGLWNLVIKCCLVCPGPRQRTVLMVDRGLAALDQHERIAKILSLTMLVCVHSVL